MGNAYPILVDKEKEIVQAIEEEEHRFGETLNQGMILLKGELEKIGSKDLPGETAFKLYDTYGFPLDLTKDVLRELDRNLDEAGFDRAMEAQREKGRASAEFSANLGQKITVSSPVEFLGYENTRANMEVLALFDLDGEPVESLSEDVASSLRIEPCFIRSRAVSLATRVFGKFRFCLSSGRYTKERCSNPSHRLGSQRYGRNWSSSRG